MSVRIIPVRVVSLIPADRFIEMWDLLQDNVALRGHLEEIRGAKGASVWYLQGPVCGR